LRQKSAVHDLLCLNKPVTCDWLHLKQVTRDRLCLTFNL